MIIWLVLKLEILVIELFEVLKDFGFFERIILRNSSLAIKIL
jgi:hypothetical protein